LIVLMRARHGLEDLRAEAALERDSAQFYLHLTDLTLREASKGAPLDKTLFNLAGMVGHSFGAIRTSIVKCGPEDTVGRVIVSSDKRDLGKIEIELHKYPEILHVLSSGRLVAIDNLSTDPTMQFVTRLTKSIDFNSILVVPIRLSGQIWGVVSMRMSNDRKKPFSDFELRYAQLIAGVIGLTLARDPANLTLPGNTEQERKTG